MKRVKEKYWKVEMPVYREEADLDGEFFSSILTSLTRGSAFGVRRENE